MDIKRQLENLKRRRQKADDNYKIKLDGLKRQKENIEKQILNAGEQHERELYNIKQQEINLKRAKQSQHENYNFECLKRLNDELRSLLETKKNNAFILSLYSQK